MIELIGELRGLSRREARRRAGAWLERLGLGQWAKNKVQDLSKGMQQKVQFATALIHEPELVILDEPWSGLDPINAEVLRDAVDEVRASGRTVLFSTHQMEQAEKVVDSVCIIARGKKLLDGKLAEIKQREAAEGIISLGFTDPGSRAVGDAVLADRALVADQRSRRAQVGGDVAECEVKLAEGVTSQQLLAALVTAGATVRRFEVVVPTLHQIFVDRVGASATVAERRPEAS
jgi:ABC-2 type transport system ATP-binding protein